jgi:serine protease
MPYADTSARACDAGYHPNSSTDPDADATINVTSHEHNETITDPLGSAWFDSSGYENGDKCAWTFGGVGSNRANQTINGNSYILQQEWSNATSRCVLTGT